MKLRPTFDDIIASSKQKSRSGSQAHKVGAHAHAQSSRPGAAYMFNVIGLVKKKMFNVIGEN